MDHWYSDEPAGICCFSIFPPASSLSLSLSHTVPYFVHLTRMDRHNFSAKSSIPDLRFRPQTSLTKYGRWICVSMARLSRVFMFLRIHGRSTEVFHVITASDASREFKKYKCLQSKIFFLRFLNFTLHYCFKIWHKLRKKLEKFKKYTIFSYINKNTKLYKILSV